VFSKDPIVLTLLGIDTASTETAHGNLLDSIIAQRSDLPMESIDRRQFLESSVTTVGAVAILGVSTIPHASGADAKTTSTSGARPMTAEHALKPRFSIQDSVVLLVDHQTGTVSWIKSLPMATVIASCRVLAKMAVTYGMPLVLTTTMEEYVGPTIPELQEVAADAFAKRFKRGGQLSCWDDPALQSAVHALGRKNLILAGLTTDICLYWAARDAVRLGYQVMVVADACGTMSTLGDELTYASLREMGVRVTVVNTAVTELVNNFGTPEGQKAQKIMSDEIISKLGK
jgi:nicotinamidase-related amidase